MRTPPVIGLLICIGCGPRLSEESTDISALSPCSRADRTQLLQIAEDVELVALVSPRAVAAGAVVTLRGHSFSLLPAGTVVRYVSFITNDHGGLDASSVDGTYTPNPAQPDTELTAVVPAGVKEGLGMVVLGLPDTCTWASAGQIVTGEQLATFAIRRPVTFGRPAPESNAPPVAVAGLTATPFSQTALLLDWSDGPDEYGYRVEIRETGARRFSTYSLLPQDAHMARIDGLKPGTSYDLRVYAFNDRGDSPPSPIVSASTLRPANEGAFLLMTVIDESPDTPPISVAGRRSPTIEADAAIVYRDDEKNGILEQESVSPMGNGPFPYYLVAVDPQSNNGQAWILAEGNEYATAGGSQSDLVVYATFPPTEGARAPTQGVAIHFDYDRASNTITSVYMAAGDLGQVNGRLMFSSYVGPLQSGSIALPSNGAPGRLSGSVEGILHFNETYSHTGGIGTVAHQVAVRVDFDLSVIQD